MTQLARLKDSFTRSFARAFILLGVSTTLLYAGWQVTSAVSAVRATSLENQPLPGYHSGVTLPPLLLRETSGSRALVLIVRSGCGYCTASMPFYRALLDTHPDVTLVAVCAEAIQTCTEYLKQHRLRVTTVLPLASTGLRIRGTPTLAVADADGRLIGVWLGQQTAQGELEIRSALAATAKS